MNIKIITAGKPKKDFEKLFEIYTKRLSSFCNLEIFHIKENKDFEKKILKKIEKTFLVILDEKGQNLSSQELANFLEKKEETGENNISFLIGPADGHSEEIKKRANLIISFSKLTFPHDLAMIILSETLYRSFSILKNHPYHRI